MGFTMNSLNKMADWNTIKNAVNSALVKNHLTMSKLAALGCHKEWKMVVADAYENLGGGYTKDYCYDNKPLESKIHNWLMELNRREVRNLIKENKIDYSCFSDGILKMIMAPDINEPA